MTTPHERDRSLEQWLSASLPVAGEPTDACLDAETAAAWLDGGLNSSARQMAETHLSTCARCQALVGSIVTLETADAAAEAPVPSPWRAWLNWMVPLGAVATVGLALAVWLNVPPQPVQQPEVPRQSRLEPAPDISPAAPSAKAASAPAPGVGRADQAVASPQAAPSAPTPPAAANAARTASADRTLAKAEPVAPTPPVAAAPAAPSARTAERSGPLTAADAAGPVAAQQGGVGNQAFAAREAPGFDVTSADAQVRWRLTGSLVLRSTDGGATWVPVVADAPGRLRTGAAPSATVCWLVGDSGLVLRAVDGITFLRVAAPDPADLTVVTATSAANAVVGTADGRRFVTTDGGTTWALSR